MKEKVWIPDTRLFKYKLDLEKEISYPHWTDTERYVLKKALKWFLEAFPEAK